MSNFKFLNLGTESCESKMDVSKVEERDQTYAQIHTKFGNAQLEVLFV